MSGSKGLATTVADSIGSELDLQLCDLRAERRPGEGCVHGDDVSPRPVVHRFEEIAACAVDLSERDERATKVMAASLAQPERSEIIMQLLRRLLRRALGEVARRVDRGDPPRWIFVDLLRTDVPSRSPDASPPYLSFRDEFQRSVPLSFQEV